jgi:hypothetical protein
LHDRCDGNIDHGQLPDAVSAKPVGNDNAGHDAVENHCQARRERPSDLFPQLTQIQSG